MKKTKEISQALYSAKMGNKITIKGNRNDQNNLGQNVIKNQANGFNPNGSQ